MTGKETLRQIIDGLDGVYDGPWELDEFQRDMRPNGLVMSAHGTIIAEIRGYLDSCGNRENGLHIARCHPDAIRAIAEYVEALEADLDAVTTYAAVLEAALEKCQKALAAMIDPSCIAQSTVLNAFAMATEAEAAARAALEADQCAS